MAAQIWISAVQAVSSIAGAVAAALIARAGIRISHRQSITASQKLRLDMFPLRLAVYKIATDALLNTLNQPVNKDDERSKLIWESIILLRDRLPESRFLFDKENYEYFDTLFKALWKQQHLVARLRRSQNHEDPEWEKLYQQCDDAEIWLTQQLSGMPIKLESQMKVAEGSTFSKNAIAREDPPIATAF